jgi:hypothetical protein
MILHDSEVSSATVRQAFRRSLNQIPSALHCLQSQLQIVPILSMLAMAGCGSGERIYHLQGKVTYEGKPVPQGYIVFEPDSSHGNTGAAARSKIEDGQYNTRATQGRGTIGGPHLIRIVGLNGKISQANEMEEESLPRPLFSPYTLAIELPKQDSVMDFEIPSH